MSEETDGYVKVQNVGGIDSAEVALGSGITVLAGENATNRTSMITAINAVLGGSRALPNVSKGGEGHIEAQLGSGTYSRKVSSTGQGVAYSGDPVSPSVEVVDAYATLDSRNPIRRVIEQGDVDAEELRDLLMLPVDDEELRREIGELRRQRDELEKQLENIERKKEKLPELESQKQELREELDEVEGKLESKQEEIEQLEVGVDTAEEAETLLAELEDAEQELDKKNERLSDASETLQTAREELENLRDRRAEIESSLDSGDKTNKARMEELENKRNRLDGIVDLLTQAERSVRQFSGSERIPNELSDTSGDVLAGLTEGEEDMECWACGSIVSQSAFDEQAARLSELASEYRDRMRGIEDEIDEIREKQNEQERMKENLQEIETRIRERERTVEQYEDRVAQLEKEVSERQERVNELREQVEETEELRGHPIVDLHDEARELSRTQGRLEREFDDLTDQIATIEQTVEQEEELREKREELSDEIEALNARVHQLEEAVVERLQDHLDQLVDLLDYEEIERVRVDLRRYDENGNEVGLTVVRDSDGAAIEDSYRLESLSESERSLVGICVALAAYQTHDIAEEVPMVLLDSVEEFDGERVQQLVEYIADEVPRIVVSLLPGDAGAVSADMEVPADALA